jgi:CHASE3 domain sensor protein
VGLARVRWAIMSFRRRVLIDLAVGVVVTAFAMGVTYWQAATAPSDSARGETFRLVCPLH